MKIAASLCPVALTIPLLAPADTLWRQYGFDAAHTSYNKNETILSNTPTSDGSLFFGRATRFARRAPRQHSASQRFL
jgi:hypothetical protein